jgi:large subunit ribosomal protein L6e
LSGVDSKKIDEVAGDKYFASEKGDKKKGEEQFFKQGEKPEVRKYALAGEKPTLTIE